MTFFTGKKKRSDQSLPDTTNLINGSEKKYNYNAIVLQVDTTFLPHLPLVFNTTGGMGGEVDRVFKHLAQKISNKGGQLYALPS